MRAWHGSGAAGLGPVASPRTGQNIISGARHKPEAVCRRGMRLGASCQARATPGGFVWRGA
eukprot:13157637-Alexandrium_andersonii.AAC.1